MVVLKALEASTDSLKVSSLNSSRWCVLEVVADTREKYLKEIHFLFFCLDFGISGGIQDQKAGMYDIIRDLVARNGRKYSRLNGSWVAESKH